MDDLTSEKYWNTMINQSLLRYCLLKVLEKEELHGYVIPEKINEFSKGYCPSPSPGTLYTTLSDLEKKEILQNRLKKSGKRQIKAYKLTPKGKIALKQATKAWSRATFLIAKTCIYSK
jgi:DNA-binding PadR family transcriptional regulator